MVLPSSYTSQVHGELVRACGAAYDPDALGYWGLFVDETEPEVLCVELLSGGSVRVIARDTVAALKALPNNSPIEAVRTALLHSERS